MTVVNLATGEIIEPMSADEARRLTTEAQTEFGSAASHFSRGWELIELAVQGGGHLALGYRSPSDYLNAEFDGVLAGLNIAERRTAVRTMSAWGLSNRAISTPLGVDEITVRRDLSAGATYVAPDEDPADFDVRDFIPPYDEADSETPEQEEVSVIPNLDDVDERDSANTPEPTPAPVPDVVTGIDGKKYPKKQTPPAPRRKPLDEAFFTAVYDTQKKVESLHRLTADDRFPQNAEKVGTRYRADLLGIRDLLDQVINSLTQEPTS